MKKEMTQMTQTAVMPELRLIPLDLIDIPEFQMRKVETDSVVFKSLKKDIQKHGLLQAVSVSEQINPETNELNGRFTLNFGFHRTLACKELYSEGIGPSTIKAEIDNIQGKGDLAFKQMRENLHRQNARPMEFARQLERIMSLPEYYNLTLPEVLDKLGCTQSPSWVSQLKGLNKLKPNIQQMVDAGEMPIGNAIYLCRLPSAEQEEWVERAINMGQNEFRPKCQERLTEIKAAQKGEEIPHNPYSGAKLRSLKEVKEMLEEVKAGKQIFGSPEAALKWIISMDDETVAEKERQKNLTKEQREAALNEKKEMMKKLAEIAKDPSKFEDLKRMMASA